jgi:hypothetical protein
VAHQHEDDADFCIECTAELASGQSGRCSLCEALLTEEAHHAPDVDSDTDADWWP